MVFLRVNAAKVRMHNESASFGVLARVAIERLLNVLGIVNYSELLVMDKSVLK